MKIEIYKNKIKRNDFTLALNLDVFKCGNWITDGAILIDTDIIDVVANVRSDNDKLDCSKTIKKWTNKNTLKDVLKEENEVEIGKFGFDNFRLMYHVDGHIKEIINEFYINQFLHNGFAFSFYNDMFYIFDILDYIEEPNEELEENVLYVQLVGVLMKSEVTDKEYLNNLWNLEQIYKKELLNEN